jgi:hypothetical protein
MTKPIVLFTNLFTLKNKCVKSNRYIDMYYIWLNNILKYGKLTTNDYCITFVDDVTYNYLKDSPVFKFLITKIPNTYFIIYSQPNIIKDGMMKRYNIEELQKITQQIEEKSPIYLYLDVDVLLVNNIRELFNESNTSDTTIFLRPEVQFDFLNGLFYGQIVTDEDKELYLSKNVKLPGFSSGIFGWTNSEKIKSFFDFVKNKASTNDKELYTVDQPFFNAALFNYFFKETGQYKFITLDRERIVENHYVNSNQNQKIVLINYCGIPGDDSFHWDKMLLHLFIDTLTT